MLQDKRASLVVEFQRQRGELLSDLSKLAELAAAAQQRLDDALADPGPEATRSAALTAGTGIAVNLTRRVVAGVAVHELEHPDLVRTPFQRGWSRVLVAAEIDVAAHAHEVLLNHLLDLGVRELAVRRLAQEIARTTRQINALETVLLPRLAAESHQITLTLDEREREEHVRLRSARRRQTARQEATRR